MHGRPEDELEAGRLPQCALFRPANTLTQASPLQVRDIVTVGNLQGCFFGSVCLLVLASFDPMSAIQMPCSTVLLICACFYAST